MTKQLRRLRYLLWLTTLACVALGVSGILSIPHNGIAAIDTPPFPENLPAAPQSPPSTEKIDLSGLWKVDLRRPLYDPPPPTIPVAAPPLPPAIQLAGTIIEAGEERAVLILPDGRSEIKRIGEIAADATILSIEPTQVTVQHHGTPVIIQLQEKPGS